MNENLTRQVLMLFVNVSVALFGSVQLGLPQSTPNQPTLRLIGRLTRSNGAPAVGEIIYVFAHKEGKCGWALGPTPSGTFMPRDPQAKTDKDGRFAIEFNRTSLRGATKFCVGQLVQGTTSVEMSLFADEKGATWVQDLSIFQEQREIDLTKVPIRMVSDKRSKFDLKPSGTEVKQAPGDTAEIKGRLIEEKTGKPLEGMQLALMGYGGFQNGEFTVIAITVKGKFPPENVTSDQEGRFVFSGLKEGQYIILPVVGGIPSLDSALRFKQGAPSTLPTSSELAPAGIVVKSGESLDLGNVSVSKPK